MSQVKFLLLSVSFVAFFVVSAESQQDDKKQIIVVQEKLLEGLQKGNPLIELEYMRPLWVGKIKEAASGNSQDNEFQQSLGEMLMNASTTIGNYKDALRYGDNIGEGTLSESELSRMKGIEGYKPVKALDAILKMADSAQIILINEAHHKPQNRAFTLELIKVLRRKGFTYFAAETLNEQRSDPNLNERGYPVNGTGFYTSEPLYGDLIRNALKLGYHAVPYDYWRYTGKYDPEAREQAQAKNLFENILKNDPKAKIIVHAGYTHINESGTIAGVETMAQRLKKMTGIDPLTIDQTVMSEHSAPELEHPLYRSIMEKYHLLQASIFENSRGEWWTFEEGKRDVTIFSPRSVYKNGRPTWLSLGGKRKSYKLPHDICGTAGHCLVQARLVGESSDAVPIDQIEVLPNEKPAVLMLPAGNFELKIRNAVDETLKTFRIKQR